MDASRGEVVAQLQGLMGDSAARAIEAMVQSANKPGEGLTSTLVGTALLLVGATTVFAELQDALDRIWRAPERTKRRGIWNLLRERLLSFGLILAIGFLILVSLVFSAAMAALGRWLGPAFEGWEALAHVVDFVVSFTLVSGLFALIYKVMPRVHVAWRDVWIGAVVTAALFTIGKLLIGIYIGKSGVASVFSAKPARLPCCWCGSTSQREDDLSAWAPRDSPGVRAPVGLAASASANGSLVGTTRLAFQRPGRRSQSGRSTTRLDALIALGAAGAVVRPPRSSRISTAQQGSRGRVQPRIDVLAESV
jgi:hypothetical protein